MMGLAIFLAVLCGVMALAISSLSGEVKTLDTENRRLKDQLADDEVWMDNQW